MGKRAKDWVRIASVWGPWLVVGCGGQTMGGSADPAGPGGGTVGTSGGWTGAQGGTAGRPLGTGGQATPDHCGNGVAEPALGEACDDGVNGGGYGQCAAGCVWGERCGDGRVQGAYEQCDDGNDVAGDGCAQCRLEEPDPCPQYPGCFPTYVCGNGKVDPGERCDDGNAASGDGCPSGCNYVEAGYVCPVPGQPCRKFCGNGVVEPDLGESCDDGALNGEPNHCPADCGVRHCGDGVIQVELGETCDDGVNDGSYRGCTPDCQRAAYCGDGMLQPEFGEQCDLGSANDPMIYGGCTANCQLGPHCGDGVVQQPYEACDDGNHACCDGCGAACMPELMP